MSSDQAMISTSVANKAFGIKEEMPVQEGLVLKQEAKSSSSGTKKPAFVCSACGKSFSKKNSFAGHVNTHFEKKKPLGCHLCDKHLLKKVIDCDKTRPKTDPCDRCDVSFSQFSELFKYKKTSIAVTLFIACGIFFLHLASTLHTGSP